MNDIKAWLHDDGERVISASQKARALHDGGATASSVAGYNTPLALSRPAGQDELLAMCNDLNAVYGNTDTARAKHLLALGYRKQAAPPEQREVEGFVLVPRVLTDSMFAAHLAHLSVSKKPPAADGFLLRAQAAWDAMLAAAPTPPKGGDALTFVRRYPLGADGPAMYVAAEVDAALRAPSASKGEDHG